MQPALCAIVVGAFHGYSGPVGALLESPPARFLSKISYGVYIYHLMVWWLVVQWFPELFHKNFTTFAVVSSLTIIVATASWYLIEEPVSRLKRLFPATGRAPALPAQSAA
jgi:peptidoglycan/LPS O-acetylase OafA/YrhL